MSLLTKVSPKQLDLDSTVYIVGIISNYDATECRQITVIIYDIFEILIKSIVE